MSLRGGGKLWPGNQCMYIQRGEKWPSMGVMNVCVTIAKYQFNLAKVIQLCSDYYE